MEEAIMELEPLLESAIVKRSEVKNLRPLKELTSINVASSYECAQPTLALIQYLSPPLQKEISSRMAASNENRLTPAKAAWVFELASRLLNTTTKEFDFGIFGGQFQHCADYERAQKVWHMLAEKCPNLEQINDKRYHETDSSNPKKKNLHIKNVMPFLQKFGKLKHIVLKYYICDSEDLVQLAHHFPKLLTLTWNDWKSIGTKTNFSILTTRLCLESRPTTSITLKPNASNSCRACSTAQEVESTTTFVLTEAKENSPLKKWKF
ncbi:uncharacterized protein LOC132201375 isoform X3 [Neocloeon triangulifer]|uniref:uncharacterized protein LOC132201375 isoform X3 n=1 Tax=Neocloeon triangulifer TaxID=2078957 RepID=UPI00286F15FD|nr:uncharacterized protein LOC132201375 isoform X3 [Neocloeon triangulifer]